MYWENAPWQGPARALEVFQGRVSGVRVAQSPSLAHGWLPTARCKGRQLLPEPPFPQSPGGAPVPSLNQAASSPRAGAEQPLVQHRPGPQRALRSVGRKHG